MIDTGFISRLKNFGFSHIFLAKDSVLSLAIFIFLNFMSFNLCEPLLNDLLSTIITVSAALFSIVLTGFAIITTYTDEDYIVAWMLINKYEQLITFFQFNLYIPLSVLLFTIITKFFITNCNLLIYLSIASFFYMIFALFDLIKFISEFALMRGIHIYSKKNKI